MSRPARSTAYDPQDVEARIARLWHRQDAFRTRPARDAAGARPYCILMPPPNVTGSLHMGHALNATLQDVLIRFERMRGRDVLWQPGVDHAGIATQMVVERQLAKEQNQSRRQIGRQAFTKRVWQWKDESGGKILEQLRRLGASADWSRQRFTMDPGFSQAVIKVFVALYRKKLIYKDTRLVNWDPVLQTAISDLEVDLRETKGRLWHFRYPLEDQPGAFITVATTRPETMLGDSAVAVHPEDRRWRHLIGRKVRVPPAARAVPVIADPHADPEQGSGAVKITPAHDFDDFEVGRRHDLAQIDIFDSAARLNQNAPPQWRGLPREEAREKITAWMKERGLLEKVESHVMALPFGDRSQAVVEPRLTEQWYLDAEKLAPPALEAVRAGRTRFIPARWDKTYFEWLRRIQPWCISRQLWWGHQIPAWYGPDEEIFVAHDAEEARRLARAHYGRDAELRQEEDVLDTWFSSALWPFVTLGWPEKTPELARFYPSQILVTGFDIIFFWVARMMMMGLHFIGQAPFEAVYIHALVRDARGRKMSKSQGNAIDPLNLIDAYGADALRFTLAAMASPGRDIKLAEARVAGYRNFTNKLWNAARFCRIHHCPLDGAFDPATARASLNRWIIARAAACIRQTTEMLEACRFDAAAAQLYEFVWHVFCDWHLELIKPVLAESSPEAQETRAATGWVLAAILKLLHPFMPFVTEALWGQVQPGGLLAHARWPKPPPAYDPARHDGHEPARHNGHEPARHNGHENEQACQEIEWIIALVGAVRSLRAQLRVPPAARLELIAPKAGDRIRQRYAAHAATVQRLARLDGLRFEAARPEGAAQILLEGAVFFMPLAGIVDLKSEAKRLRREEDKARREAEMLARKLADPGFAAKAPAEVAARTRARLAQAQSNAEARARALEQIGGG